MQALMRAIGQLMTFRIGGESMPHSPRLLLVLLFAMLAVDALLASLIQDNLNTPLAIALRLAIGQALLLLFLHGNRRHERFVQTSIALTLVTLVVTIVTSPLVLQLAPLLKEMVQLSKASDPAARAQLQMTPVQSMIVLTLAPLMVWLLLLRAAILRGAVDCRWPMALLMSVALLIAEAVLTTSLLDLIFGKPAPA
jgi:hypothetical protein